MTAPPAGWVEKSQEELFGPVHVTCLPCGSGQSRRVFRQSAPPNHIRGTRKGTRFFKGKDVTIGVVMASAPKDHRCHNLQQWPGAAPRDLPASPSLTVIPSLSRRRTTPYPAVMRRCRPERASLPGNQVEQMGPRLRAPIYYFTLRSGARCISASIRGTCYCHFHH